MQNSTAAEAPACDIDPAALVHVRLLGEGAFAAAWLCTYRGALVTAKELSLESDDGNPLVSVSDKRMIFRLEGNTLAALRHPNVAEYLGAHYPQERSAAAQKSYLVSRYYPQTLVDCVGGRAAGAGALPLQQQLRLAYEVACGLEYLDAQRIVHNDIKPSNILVDEDGHALIADFGLARVMQTPKLGLPYAGSPAYMSPEKRRKTPYDRRSDVFSYAIVLYYIFAGEDDSFCAPYKDDVDHRPPPPRAMPPFAAALLARCWAADPAARPAPTLVRRTLAQRTLAHFFPRVAPRVFWARNFCDLSDATGRVSVLTAAVYPRRLHAAVDTLAGLAHPAAAYAPALQRLCDAPGQVSLALVARLCRWFPAWLEDARAYDDLLLAGWFLGCVPDRAARAAARAAPHTVLVRCPAAPALEHDAEFVVYRCDDDAAAPPAAPLVAVRSLTAADLAAQPLPLTRDIFASFLS